MKITNHKTKSGGDTKNKRVSSKYRRGKITLWLAFLLAGIVIFVLLLFVLMKTGVMDSPSFLRDFFDNGKNPDRTEGNTQSGIPDFSADSSLANEHYHTFPVDPRETLAGLTTQESYVREFRVINAYGGEADIQKYKLTVDGDRYRLESDFKTVLCDGENAYTITGTYRTSLNDTVFTPEYEVGITSLADVKEAAEKGSVTYSDHNGDEKILLIVSEDAESGVLAEYTVSIETGIVLTERSYVNGELYRAVITDSTDVFAAADLPEDYFEIPKEEP